MHEYPGDLLNIDIPLFDQPPQLLLQIKVISHTLDFIVLSVSSRIN